jgi:hypothetical protein
MLLSSRDIVILVKTNRIRIMKTYNIPALCGAGM